MVGARGVGMALSLVSVTISTRLLLPSVYALIAYVNVISYLVFTVTTAWTGTAVFRYGREELERTGQMTGTTWARATLTAPLTVAAVPIVLAAFILGVFPHQFSIGFVCAALGMGLLMAFGEHFLYMTQAAGRIRRGAIAQVGQQALAVATLALLFFSGVSGSPGAVIAISVGASSLYALWLGAGIWRVAIWPPRVDRLLRQRMLRLSAPLMAFVVSDYVIRSVDLFAIGALRPVADVGVYAVAYQVFVMGYGLATALPPVFQPLLVSLHLRNRSDLVTRYLDRIVPQIAFLAAVI